VKSATAPRPPLVRGWSGKVILPTHHFKSDETEVLVQNASKSGIVQIARELTENDQLERLDLRGHFLIPPDGLTLGRGLESNGGLRALDLRNNDLSDEGVANLATGFVGHAHLQELNLSSNLIGDAGCVPIQKWLQCSDRAQRLSLSDNHIGADGARALGQGLAQSPTMRVLQLGNNDLRDAGTEFIAAAIHKGCALAALDLSGNAIGNLGAKALARALCSGECLLQRLVLRINRIREPGLRAVLSSLHDNPVLLDLDLCGNIVEDNVTEYICGLLHNTKRLAKLNLEDNFLTDKFATQALKALERNVELPVVFLPLGGNRLSDGEKNQIDLLVRTNANELAKKARDAREGSWQTSGGSSGRKASRKGSRLASRTGPRRIASKRDSLLDESELAM